MKLISFLLVSLFAYQLNAQNLVSYRSCMLNGSSSYFLNGTAFLELYDDGSYKFRLSNDYATNTGPDVQVHLTNDNSFSTPIDTVGGLFIEDFGTFNGISKFSGAYSKTLTSGISSLSDFDHLVFVCVQFNFLHWGNGSFGPEIQCSQSTATLTTTSCGDYTAPSGATFSTSGTYMDTVVMATGCDSIYTINLTVNTPPARTDVYNTCGSFTWIDGNTYTNNNNTATHVVNNPNGCDSIITLDLTITPLDDASFNYTSSTFCLSGVNPTPNIMGLPGGVFSSNGLTVDSNTGIIDLNMSGTGSYNVTYTTQGICPNSSMVNITISNAPDASFNYNSGPVFCGTGLVTPSFSSGASAGVFSSSAGLMLNTTTGEMDLTNSTPGNYTVVNTIPASGGCTSDSDTSMITVLPVPSYTQVLTECYGFNLSVNGNLYTNSGVYVDTILNGAVNGCDSIVTTDLTIANLIDTSVSLFGTTLTVAENGADYVWIDCSTLTPIIGETGQTFVAQANGSYAAVVTQGNCSDTSACIEVTGFVGVEDLEDIRLKVFPNPTEQSVTLEINTPIDGSTEFVLMNALGIIVDQQVIAGKHTIIDLSNLPSGIYLLEAHAKTIKIFKQ